MDVRRIKSAVAIIERHQRALAWLEEYGSQLTGTNPTEISFEADVRFARSCHGASDAAEMLGNYARRSVPDLVRVAIENCRNTIAMEKAAIQEEAGQ